jgi:hypothetical protein
MPDERSDVDTALARLDERIARLRAALPAPTPPAPVPPRRSPKTTARTILVLFIVMAGFLLLQDVAEIFFIPDQFVFVAREGKRFHVWENSRAYEADTGKNWIEQSPWDTDLVAHFHGARRSRALHDVGSHFLFLALSVVAFRAVGRLRDDSSTEPGAADPTGAGNELTAS